jgi:hypothetical protein
MKKALLACAVLTVPLAARAQTTGVNFTLTSPQSITLPTQAPQIFVGKAACPTEILNFHWDMTAQGLPATGQVINIVQARSSSTCGSTTVSAPDILTVAPTQTSTGDDNVSAQNMILDPDAGLPGGCTNNTTSSAQPWSTFFCVQVAAAGVAQTSTIFQAIQVNFAMAPPTAPVQVSVVPGDSHFKVYWQKGNSAENIINYDVYVLGTGDTFDPAKKAATTTSLNADVQETSNGVPLQNNVTYAVQVVANDPYGNISSPSGVVQGTPVPVLDFYELYRLQGGSATGGGGCSSTGSATWWWIAALALAVGIAARRRKRARNGAALIALFALFAPRAQAQQAERPPRFLLVAFKLDRYNPQIDSEAGLTGQPYKEIFGTHVPWRYQVEVDWEAWHPFGTFMLGGTVGIWQNYGKGLMQNPQPPPALVPSQDTASLNIVPIGVIATYRFDKLADWWAHFPVIPYAQAGLMRALWASFNGTGDISKPVQGGRGSGWTWGYTTALGVALALDAIDPDLSREAYADTGVQRTSLFAEYGWTYLSNFGHSGAMVLSDRSWRFGVSIEF